MRIRTATVITLAGLAAVGAPAHAAPKKPITKSYSVTLTPAPVEDPLNGTACDSTLREQGKTIDIQTVKVTGPGKLKVEVTGFTGDWDTAIWGPSGVLSEGGGTSTPDAMSTAATPLTETASYKAKKAQTLFVRVCNFAGGPTANVKYTFTYS